MYVVNCIPIGFWHKSTLIAPKTQFSVKKFLISKSYKFLILWFCKGKGVDTKTIFTMMKLSIGYPMYTFIKIKD